jgi:hypothetical protein
MNAYRTYVDRGNDQDLPSYFIYLPNPKPLVARPPLSAKMIDYYYILD